MIVVFENENYAVAAFSLAILCRHVLWSFELVLTKLKMHGILVKYLRVNIATAKV